MTDYYPYRIVTRRGDLTLIWQPGEGNAHDQFLVDDLGGLLAFHDLKSLQAAGDRNGWDLCWEGEGTLDLAALRRWVLRPDLGSATAGLLLAAWNFFEDLSRSVQISPSLPIQGPVHDNAYEKLFGGEPLAPDAGDDAWTDAESETVREFLSAGLTLWEQATQGSAYSSYSPA